MVKYRYYWKKGVYFILYVSIKFELIFLVENKEVLLLVEYIKMRRNKFNKDLIR